MPQRVSHSIVPRLEFAAPSDTSTFRCGCTFPLLLNVMSVDPFAPARGPARWKKAGDQELFAVL